MERSLVEWFSEVNNAYIFAFAGFDNWEDFDKTMSVIEEVIKPEYCDYGGMTDMHGVFKKNGLTVDVRFSSMTGNDLFFKGERTEENLQRVREWAKIIFNNLMLDAAVTDLN